MKKIIIAAVSENFVIGKNGRIPWHNKEEIAHFRKTTTGFPVLMGRKTFESIGNPLKDRINIVITHNKFYNQQFPQVLVFDSITSALEYCEKKFEKVFIIGGESIFNQTILIADEIILSKMKFNIDGDAHFPYFELNQWELSSVEDFKDFTIYHYIKKQN
ncbi:dihydrofolate reductase [Rosettibacter firmus]|uniref:dihydrofolate reductase n=1 Tax=Rosettibacter firmus TaxID=3111522 RepID=UPI00336BC2E5